MEHGAAMVRSKLSDSNLKRKRCCLAEGQFVELKVKDRLLVSNTVLMHLLNRHTLTLALLAITGLALVLSLSEAGSREQVG
jgi:hypothetical protein